MPTSSPARIRALAAICAALLAACLSVWPAGAGAATVANGDFETGTLAGWQLFNKDSTSMGGPPSGSWFAYSGTTSPFDPEAEFGSVPPPPAGKFAAITAQGGPGMRFMYQDVTLEPYYSHQLSMLVYYQAGAPLATPSPNTLELPEETEIMLTEAEPNEQYRIDVIKPTAPLASLAPGDVLGTVFATQTGDPQTLAPKAFGFDLTPYAGQTVRLRLAEVDNEGILNAGVDSVAIQSTPPSNAFTLGKRKPNKKKGSLKLTASLPGPGQLTIAKKKVIKPVTAAAAAAGDLTVILKPTGKTMKALKKNGKAKRKVAVTFTPTGGLPATQVVKVTLKLKLG